MKLKEVLDKTIQFFKDKHIETPRLDTEILFTEALGFKSRVDLYLKYDQPLNDDDLNRCREFVRRRTQGEPVAYIIGKKEFFGLPFLVDSHVLIPRPETELLVEEALKWIETNKIENPKILDLGCGSGCIGLSLIKKIPGATLIAVDKSSDSLQVAKKNAEALGLSSQVEFLTADVAVLDFATEKFDLVLANPPYIDEQDPLVQAEVKKFEPNMALFSLDQGYADLIMWSQKAKPWLKAKSFLGFEMGWQQSEKMKKHFAGLEIFDQIRLVKDLGGYDRHIIGEKNEH